MGFRRWPASCNVPPQAATAGESQKAMTIWETLILGIVQGVSEFLPISSSGHLVIIESLLPGSHGDLGNLELNVALHFGTLLSILVVYRKEILPTLRQPRLVAAIVVATLPVVVSGLLLKGLFELASTRALWAGYGLLVTAGLLFLTPRIDSGQRGLSEIRLVDALVIGLFQAVAPWPGVSRSGSTIVAALLMGLRRDAAANFSFYIAVPALLGAAVLTSKKLVLGEQAMMMPLTPILIGATAAFLVGIAALRGLLRLVAQRRLIWFAWYVAIVATATIAGVSAGLIPQQTG